MVQEGAWLTLAVGLRGAAARDADTGGEGRCYRRGGVAHSSGGSREISEGGSGRGC